MKNAKPLPEWRFEESRIKAERAALTNRPELLLDVLVVTEWLQELARVCDLAFKLRRGIFSGLMFQGHQEWEITEAQRREFIALQVTIADTHKASKSKVGRGRGMSTCLKRKSRKYTLEAGRVVLIEGAPGFVISRPAVKPGEQQLSPVQLDKLAKKVVSLLNKERVEEGVADA